MRDGNLLSTCKTIAQREKLIRNAFFSRYFTLFICSFHSFFMKRDGAQFDGIFILLHKTLLVQCANVATNDLSQTKKIEKISHKKVIKCVTTDCPVFILWIVHLYCSPFVYDSVFPIIFSNKCHMYHKRFDNSYNNLHVNIRFSSIHSQRKRGRKRIFRGSHHQLKGKNFS